MLKILKSNKGSVIGIVGFILIIIGTWSVYQWYKTHTLKQNIGVVTIDSLNVAEKWTLKVVQKPEDQQKVIDAFEKIKSIVNEYLIVQEPNSAQLNKTDKITHIKKYRLKNIFKV
jgi:hypothetical protein